MKRLRDFSATSAVIRVSLASLLLSPLALGLRQISSGDGLTLGLDDSSGTLSSLSVLGRDVGSPPLAGQNHGLSVHFSGTQPLGPSVLADGGFESPGTTSWTGIPDHGTKVSGGARTGTWALSMAAGASAVVEQAATFSAPMSASVLRVSGWSKTVGSVGGSKDANYAVCGAVTYADSTSVWDLCGTFSVGTHDWEEAYYSFSLSQPVTRVWVFVVFRGTHTGTVLFDDISAQLGNDTELSSSTSTYSALTGGNGFVQTTTVPGEVKAVTTWTSMDKHVQVDAVITNLASTSHPTRPALVTFSLPLPAASAVGSEQWFWGASGLPDKSAGDSGTESSLFSTSLTGARCDHSPLAVMYSGSVGIGLAASIEKITCPRFSYSRTTQKFSVTFNTATVAGRGNAVSFSILVFKLDQPAWGWRSGLDKYHEIFSRYFRSNAILDQGLWMVSDKVSTVEGWEDFSFKFFEGEDEPVFFNNHSIMMFPYLEPALTHLSFATLPPTPQDMMNYVVSCAQSTTNDLGVREQCKHTLASGSRTANGELLYTSENEDWNRGAVFGASCSDLQTVGTRGKDLLVDAQEYQDDANARRFRIHGIFLDSLEPEFVDYDPTHIRQCRSDPFADEAGMPYITVSHATLDFCFALATTLHGRGQYLMANGAYYRFSSFATCIDVAGTETWWLQGTNYRPLSHQELTMFRALTAQKPYTFLQKPDMSAWTAQMTVEYLDLCLHYGMWPGFLPLSSTVRYWNSPTFYNRDRPAFRRYMPLLRVITSAGWQPVACLRGPSAAVLVERWGPAVSGAANTAFFTLRQESGSVMTDAALTLDMQCLGATSATITELSNTTVGEGLVQKQTTDGTFSWSLRPSRTGVLKVVFVPAPESSGSSQQNCQCSSGDCCDGCHFRPATTVCRASTAACDSAESCTGTSAACPADANGCILAMWKFNEGSGTTTADSSGNGFSGALVGMTSRQWATGLDGKALRFLNNAGVVTVADASKRLAPAGDVSYSVWLKLSSPGADQPIINNGVYQLYRSSSASAAMHWLVAVQNKSAVLGDSSWAGTAGVLSHTLFRTYRWYHVVGVRSGDDLLLYVNGKLDKKVACMAGQTPDVALATSVTMGRFAGTLDEVTVFSDPLTESQVASEFQKYSGRTQQDEYDEESRAGRLVLSCLLVLMISTLSHVL